MLKKFRQKVTFALGAVVGWITLVKSDRIMEGFCETGRYSSVLTDQRVGQNCEKVEEVIDQFLNKKCWCRIKFSRLWSRERIV